MQDLQREDDRASKTNWYDGRSEEGEKMIDLYAIIHSNGTLRTWASGVPVITPKDNKANSIWNLSLQEKWVKVKVVICTPTRGAISARTTKGKTMAKAKAAPKKAPSKAPMKKGKC